METTRLTIDAAGTTATGLVAFVTGGNFADTGKTVVFAATAALSATSGGSIVTLTLGAVTTARAFAPTPHPERRIGHPR